MSVFELSLHLHTFITCKFVIGKEAAFKYNCWFDNLHNKSFTARQMKMKMPGVEIKKF
jgi:hypothetical protein